MKKRISIDQLRPGMRIEKMNRSWFLTPFLRHRMVITSMDQVEQLRAYGVRTIEVTMPDSTAESTDWEAGDLASDKPASHLLDDLAVGQPAQVSSVPFEDELPAARQVYRAAKHIIEGAMQDVRMGRAINMDAVNQIVSEMADSVIRNPDALTSLSRLKHFDEYTFYHSVNTSLLALSLGRSLGFDSARLHQLGVGTLLHDIGKTKIPLDILNKPARFESHEFEIMKQHVMRGVEVLSGTTGLAGGFLQPTLEHHERVDGTGYPHGRRRTEISEFGLIAAVVDVYDAITSDRCYHKAKPAHEALQFLFQISQQGHLDHAIVQHFIHVIGVYPVGSVVELNTGELAIVQRLNHEYPLEPVVIVVSSPGHTPLTRPEVCDLSHQTGTPRRTIVAAKDAMTCGLNPNLYLDKESV